MSIGGYVKSEGAIKKPLATVSKVKADLEEAMLRLVIDLQTHIKAKKLSGQVLRVRSGTLRRSIAHRLEGRGTDKITAHAGTNVKYGIAWEKGFTMKTKKGNTFVYPPRSFLRSSLFESQAHIRSELAKVVR